MYKFHNKRIGQGGSTKSFAGCLIQSTTFQLAFPSSGIYISLINHFATTDGGPNNGQTNHLYIHRHVLQHHLGVLNWLDYQNWCHVSSNFQMKPAFQTLTRWPKLNQKKKKPKTKTKSRKSKNGIFSRFYEAIPFRTFQTRRWKICSEQFRRKSRNLRQRISHF